jgi:SAM-dependent methyltransferase
VRFLSPVDRKPTFRDLDIAEINTIGSIGSTHALLQQLPRLAFSDYQGPERLGQLVNGARNEDICQLTYADASFDIVLSSDTLEHVPDFRAALAETDECYVPEGATSSRCPLSGRGAPPRLAPGSATTGRSFT